MTSEGHLPTFSFISRLPSKPTSRVKFSKPFHIPPKIPCSKDLYAHVRPKPEADRARAKPGDHTAWLGSFYRQETETERLNGLSSGSHLCLTHT